jgi:hypothetical protein
MVQAVWNGIVVAESDERFLAVSDSRRSAVPADSGGDGQREHRRAEEQQRER